MPVISILTACAASDAPLLEGAYRSLVSQSLEDWEWVLVEDGPTTAAAGMVARDDRVRWTNLAVTGGPANARNLGAGTARAGLLRNLDADDYLASEDTLAVTVAAFAAHSRMRYVVGPVLDVLPDGSTVSYPSPVPPGTIAPGVLYDGWRSRGHVGSVHPTSLAVRTTDFLRRGGYPGLTSSEDTAFLLPLSVQHPGFLLTDPVTMHRVRPGSLSAQPWHRHPASAALRDRLITRMCDAAGLEPPGLS